MKSMKIMIGCWILSIVFSGFARADHKQHLFDRGNQYYQEGSYQKAIEAYEEIIEMGYESADIYYNLGNAYYKTGQNAKAILHYERALRLRPHDEDIQFNLQIANLSVVDKFKRLPELFYVRYFKEFRALFGIHSLTLMTIIFYLLLMTSVLFWVVTRSQKWTKFLKPVTLSLLVILILFTFTLVSKAVYLQKNMEAIVMEAKVDVHSAPNETSTEIFTIHQGLKVTIVQKSGKWVEIRLPDGKKGWLINDVVEVI